LDTSFDEEKRGDVLSLVVRGYVERDGDLFKITPRGQKVLTDRGAGLNESQAIRVAAAARWLSGLKLKWFDRNSYLAIRLLEGERWMKP